MEGRSSINNRHNNVLPETVAESDETGLDTEASPRHDRFHPTTNGSRGEELMGPILRRKKVMSLPLGMGGDFFHSGDSSLAAIGGDGHRRVRQHSSYERQRQETPPTPRSRKKQRSSLVGGVLRRKQVSLNLLGPNDFFGVLPDEEEQQEELVVEPGAIPDKEEEQEQEEQEAEQKLFLPLRFSPPLRPKHGKTTAQSAASTASSLIDEESAQALDRLNQNGNALRMQLSSLQNKLEEQQPEDDPSRLHQALLSVSRQMQSSFDARIRDEQLLRQKLGSADGVKKGRDSNVEDGEEPEEDDSIVRATKSDWIKTGVIFVIMLAFTIVVCTWETHPHEHVFAYTPVGLACATPCKGNVTTRDFFYGHSHLKADEVLNLFLNVDPVESEDEDLHAIVSVIGAESGAVKAVHHFGPIQGGEDRNEFEESITVDFPHPGEEHYILVESSNAEYADLGFTLYISVRTPLADHSVVVAAVIMVFVYFFILIEVIHRTLVAVFGSLVALMFYFIMEEGRTETIRQVMLNMEWSTLGLLFGMMLLVGELSHTGIFEWCAVRLLMASKGSFVRLIVLLGTLTAFASAFLDNVTTMLLVAPVTIDMCSILGVDPRPYLIGEVLLSNVGGTATLIGDPPNIIIGSSYDEIGFVDFIINVLPVIFVFCVPASLLMVIGIYRYYLTSSKMRVLDTAQLKRTYPIYNEPRLMIAGTVTAFVILIFFLHSVHHKDTAWIALFGAFITISFTNPHDVQDALRNHVEWDTLLFFAGLFVLVEVCAAMGLLDAIGDALAGYIEDQPEEKQLAVAITLVLWVSSIVSAFLDNIPYTATMIPVIQILSDTLPDTLPLATLAWALSLGACLGGNGTLLGASANIVTAGISTNKGYEISFLNFLYPGMLVMIVTVAISNLYMLVRYAWI